LSDERQRLASSIFARVANAVEASAMTENVQAPVVDDEPTLANLLRASAFGHLPARFYQLLQFALPLAGQMWFAGFPRIAGWLVVLSAFGIWALCQQREERDAWAIDTNVIPARRSTWVGVARRLAGFPAGALAGGLVVEAVIHLLSIVFKCPGCAG
jgi:hypothetical protein